MEQQFRIKETIYDANISTFIVQERMFFIIYYWVDVIIFNKLSVFGLLSEAENFLKEIKSKEIKSKIKIKYH